MRVSIKQRSFIIGIFADFWIILHSSHNSTQSKGNNLMSVNPYTPSPSSNTTIPTAPTNTYDWLLIVGSSLGGVFLLIVLIGVVILFLRRRRHNSGGSFSAGSFDGYSNYDDYNPSASWCRCFTCCRREDSREGRFISSASSAYLEI